MTQLCDLGITLYFLFHSFPSLSPFLCFFSSLVPCSLSVFSFCSFSTLQIPLLFLFFSFCFLSIFFSLSYSSLLSFLCSFLSVFLFSHFFFNSPSSQTMSICFSFPPFSLFFFFKIFLSLNTSHQNLSLPKPPIVSLFSSGIYKQEEREPPCPVQSWLKVWHGVTSVQQPKSRSQGMAPLSFLHHSGRACGGMGYVRVWASGEGGREGGKAGEKTSSSPAMCLGKKKRSVVQNSTVLCFCLLLYKKK